jgi:hypothetical protein
MDSRSACFAHCQSLPRYSQEQGRPAFFGVFPETIDFFLVFFIMSYKIVCCLDGDKKVIEGTLYFRGPVQKSDIMV